MADDAGRITQLLSETSFLYGGNAAFVEDLYTRYATQPEAVPGDWRAYFDALHEQPAAIAGAAAEPSWSRRPTPSSRPDWMGALDGLWPAVEAKAGAAIKAKVQAAPRRLAGGGARRHPRQRARDHDDPRLSHPRPPRGQPRPPGAGAPRRHRRARSRNLRLRRGRPRPARVPRLRAGAGDGHHPRGGGHPQAHLLRHGGGAVHAHLRPPSRRRGCRSGSRATTRRSPSAPRARSPSSRS